MKKFSLVLSSGGIKGFAHVGVLKALEEEGIKPSSLVGTSMGGIVALLYALQPDSRFLYDKMQSISKKLTETDFGNFLKSLSQPRENFLARQLGWGLRLRSFFKIFLSKSLGKRGEFDEFLSKIFEDKTFDSLKIPCGVIATDLNTGKDILFTRGKVLTAAKATYTVPMIFEPVPYNEYRLVDGSMTLSVPVEAATYFSPEAIVISDVGGFPRPNFELKTAWDIGARTWEIALSRLHLNQLTFAHFNLTPSLKDIHWADLEKAEETYNRGYKYTREKIPRLVELLNQSLPLPAPHIPLGLIKVI